MFVRSFTFLIGIVHFLVPCLWNFSTMHTFSNAPAPAIVDDGYG